MMLNDCRMLYFMIIFMIISALPLQASTQIREQSNGVSITSSLRSDVENMVNIIEKICSSQPKDIYCQRADISERLRETLSNDSYLRPFPHLSAQTYYEFTQALKKSFEQKPDKAAYFLHLWSYVTGIPIIGLCKGRTYYKYDNHLLPEATKDECKNLRLTTTSPQFCVRTDREGKEIHRHIDMPSAISHCTWVCVKEQFADASENQLEEAPRIAWSLIENDLVPLEQIGPDTLGALLQMFLLCRDDQTARNRYSFGLVRLLQNTALYISLADEHSSGVIVSPCSKDTIRYFGFQDGVFIEKRLIDQDFEQLHTLFGEQCFVRAFFRKVPCFHKNLADECRHCRDSVRGLFFPHYSLSGLRGLTDEPDSEGCLHRREDESLKDTQTRFAAAFCCYMSNHEAPAIKVLMDYLDKQQLSTVLTTNLTTNEGSLKRLIDPSYSIVLNSTVGIEENRETHDVWQAPDFMRAVLEHLNCVEYQIVTIIDLSNNKLTDKELEQLGKALQGNILPHLWRLDLSQNRIGRKGLRALRSLLERDYFETLILNRPSIKVSSDFSEQMLKKIVWKR